MLDLMDQKVEIQDDEGAVPFQPPLEGVDVQFNNISFHYDPRQPILRNVSFSVPSGKILAIVGASGSGKSTIINLLLRFYDPVSGEVRVGGQDVRRVTQTSLRSSIGVVPQDTVLFNETIEFNIAYGRIGAGEDEVEEVARLADIHMRVVDLPDGYGTRVGECGLQCSAVSVGGGAGPPAEWWGETAGRDRPDLPPVTAAAAAGRSDLCAGHGHRADHTGGAAGGLQEQDLRHSGPPTQHRHRGRPGDVQSVEDPYQPGLKTTIPT
jgi:hypothetical protein